VSLPLTDLAAIDLEVERQLNLGLDSTLTLLRVKTGGGLEAAVTFAVDFNKIDEQDVGDTDIVTFQIAETPSNLDILAAATPAYASLEAALKDLEFFELYTQADGAERFRRVTIDRPKIGQGRVFTLRGSKRRFRALFRT
jgi:hypothetical protein